MTSFSFFFWKEIKSEYLNFCVQVYFVQISVC